MADDSATTGATMPPASVAAVPAGIPVSVSVSAPHVNVAQPPQGIPHPAAVPGQPPYPGIAPTMMMQPPGPGMPGAGMPGARVAQIQHHQSQAELTAKLNSFWHEQMEEVQLAHDFKNHLLPLARIKKIMKSDEDVRMISAEAPVLFAKACEMFILELTHRAWAQTEEAKRRTLQRSDISTAIQKTDIFDFLIDIVPRDDPKKEHGVGVGVMNAGVAMPGAIGNLAGVGGVGAVAGVGGVPAGGMSGGMPGMAAGQGVAVPAGIDAQSQMQYYMGNHAPYAGSTDPATAAAAGMMYAQPNQYAAATTGYAAGMYHNAQYMRGQPPTVMYATQQPQYNQQYLAGNSAEAPQQPPPPQS